MNFKKSVNVFAFILLTVVLTGCSSFSSSSSFQPQYAPVKVQGTDLPSFTIEPNFTLTVPEPELPTPVMELHEHAIVNMTEQEINCMAQNLYREARGEGDQGMIAVGYVVLNRMATKGYPKSVCGVVHHKLTLRSGKVSCQFSWACTSLRNAPMKPASYVHARNLAMKVMSREVENPIDDSIYFQVKTVRTAHARKSNFRAAIGNHRFFAAL